MPKNNSNGGDKISFTPAAFEAMLKDLTKKNGNGNGKPRRRKAQRKRPARRSAFNAVVPSTGTYPSTPFGGMTGRYLDPNYFDATHPSHLGLPRATGPYTTTRVTTRFSSSRQFILFGTFMRADAANDSVSILNPGGKNWSSVIALAGDDPAVPSINGEQVIDPFVIQNEDSQLLAGSGGQFTLVPAAYTVQIVNPEPLQTTSGVIYAARYRTMPDVNINTGANSGVCSTLTWAQLYSLSATYAPPRMAMAPKLAFNGLKTNLIPFDMSKLANFTRQDTVIQQTADSRWPAELVPAGFAPMFVQNPNKVALEFIVTVEYRMRFSPFTVASATHQMHAPSTDRQWTDNVRALVSQGHGMMDIAADVARLGFQAYRAYKGVRGMMSGAAIAGQGLPMIMP